ncbi:MAG: 50S ribosomal protein L24 [Henriciella sp.]|nr:50S ribosomal protein L24 [Hyphomonas sp. Mor2]NQY98134.1 50S ribosomal protein L24 [Henriciella sp.]
MAAKVKKGDRVIVLTGRNKGAEGEVLKVIPAENRVVVRGVNVVKRHTKPSQLNPQGGINSFEAPIHVSNVAMIDPRDGKATRVGFKTDEHGRKFRYAKRSGEALDV